ncbi:MAG: immune inhibitor A [Saprospiraceae bacterium]|nr:immune inhibitor A [Saprospiraceae bacterium]
MRFSYFFWLCFFNIACLSLHAQQSAVYALVRIQLGDHSMRELAALGIETDHGKHTQGRSLETVLNTEELLLVQQAGFSTEILVPDVKAWYQNGVMEQAATERNGDCDLSPSLPQEFPTPTNYTYGSMGGYHTYDELLAVIDDMAAKFPNLISVKNKISDTLLTHEGRPLWWVRISDNPSQEEGEPELLYTALHHAREPNSASQMLFFMWHMLENYETDPMVQYLVNEGALYFIPCINPDGYVYNETTDPQGGGYWRKNRRQNPNGSFGVDLNRNYGYQWGFDNTGSSSNQNSETYRGSAPFSEPETRLVRDFCLAHNFRFVLNYHTYSNILIYPWAYNNETADPAFVDFARLLTRDNGYVSGTTANVIFYDVNGSSDDWMHAETGAFAFTPEVGPSSWGFWPLPSEIDGLNKDNVWANLAAALSTLRYGEVENTESELMAGKKDTFHLIFRRYGLEDGPMTVTLTPLSSAVTSDPVSQVFDLAHLATAPFNPVVMLNDQVLPGTELLFLVEINNGSFTTVDTLRKRYEGKQVFLLNDAASASGQWNGNWSTTDAYFVSAPTSFTDSPDGMYDPNAYNYWETTMPLFIPEDAVFPRLQFWTRWNIENNYDYAQVLATGNGGNYEYLCGKYTTNGSTSQPEGLPIYDDNQNDWVLECMDLSAFVGQTISLRFELFSDGVTQLDGMYIDDVQVMYYDTNFVSSIHPEIGNAMDVRLMPNPVSGETRLIWKSEIGQGVLTVYDALGKSVSRFEIADHQTSQAIFCGNWPEGLYNVVLQAKGGLMVTRRLVVRK